MSPLSFHFLAFEEHPRLAASVPWPDTRREAYLFRRDVAQVRSVDRNVWPESDAGPTDAMRVAVAVLPRPPTQPTEDLSSYRAQIASLAGPVVTSAWHFLGYDVADLARTSGLSNCGLDASLDDASALRRRWAASLNEWHLFTDLEEALAFASMSDARVPEHAPFHVYALWEIARSEDEATRGSSQEES